MSTFDPGARLPSALADLGLSLSVRAQTQLLGHLELIRKWNRVYNLTAVREPAEMFTHHLLDSLAVVRPLAAYCAVAFASPLVAEAGVALKEPDREPRHASPPVPSSVAVHHPQEGVQRPPPTPPLLMERHVLDVGSGAGLPGVTLAIALPELLVGLAVGHNAYGSIPSIRVSCVDAVAKKSGFIRQVAAELGLSHLQALHGRIEALQIPPADVITCRAFASLSDIVRLTRGHLAPGGVWMALKGVTPTEEMAALPPDIEVFHVEPLSVPHLGAQRCLVWMRTRQEHPIENPS